MTWSRELFTKCMEGSSILDMEDIQSTNFLRVVTATNPMCWCGTTWCRVFSVNWICSIWRLRLCMGKIILQHHLLGVLYACLVHHYVLCPTAIKVIFRQTQHWAVSSPTAKKGCSNSLRNTIWNNRFENMSWIYKVGIKICDNKMTQNILQNWRLDLSCKTQTPTLKWPVP